MGEQLRGAVSAAHAAGLLHRDIKAQNVMLAPDGRAVLMDFGTGWDTADSDAARSLAGPPLYLAPELFREGKATAQSDVYSIGVLLYRMLTGAYPLHRRSLSELRAAHERPERGVAPGAGRDIPRRLARVVDRAIDPRPERRYDSARPLAHDPARTPPRHTRIPLAPPL